MHRYTPTYDVSSTISGVAEFVKKNEGHVWKIFLPMMPFVFAAYILDFVLNELIYVEGDNKLAVGELIAGYFFICMAISWHRAVIQGLDNYMRMKPKRSELNFIVAWMLIGVVPSHVLSYMNGLGSEWGFLLYIVLLTLILLAIFAVRIAFYFPAKAVGSNISFTQSIRMTRGYFWKIVLTSMFAFVGFISYWFKTIFLFLVYWFIVLTAFFAVYGLNEENIEDVLELPLLDFLGELPLSLYFSPIFVAIGSMITSNYYLDAIQNPKEN